MPSGLPDRMRVVWMPVALTGSAEPAFPFAQTMSRAEAMRTAADLSTAGETRWVRVEDVFDRSRVFYSWEAP